MESEQPGTGSTTEASSWLLHQSVVAGIVSAASRFIPIPFVDDIVRDQCRRFVVARTLAAHDNVLSLDELKPFYSSGDSCLVGCAGMLIKAPLKLLLFPIRKIVSVVTSVRGVPLEIMRMVLLGRTLDRYLRDGKLVADSGESRQLPTQMRLAFEESFARMDFHVVRAAMGDALTSVNGWKTAAIASAKGLAERKQTEEDGLDSDETIDTGASRVQKVLDRPDTLVLFQQFDQRFDQSLDRLSRSSNDRGTGST